MIFEPFEAEERIGYVFKDKSLLRRAFTHASAGNEDPASRDCNETLEFLGDALLGFIVAETLMQRYPGEREGALTRRRSAVVSEKPLAGAVRSKGLQELMIFSRGEQENGMRSDALCADLFEAVTAAIYLDGAKDGGMAAARKFVLTMLEGAFKAAPPKALAEGLERPARQPARQPVRMPDAAPEADSAANYKSVLNDHCQKSRCGVPAYRQTGRRGPDHKPEFTVRALAGGREFPEGKGGSLREAEQAAAREALIAMGVLKRR